jgi:transcriptional regulator with GAF, ATPase, and Fis domain
MSSRRETTEQAIIDTAQDDKLIGQSPAFLEMLRIVGAVAGNDCIVLLEGESGTGKELIARRIHDRSSRGEQAFIPVNCPAVAESLFESQFYGHVKGSFTGAQGDTLGMVRAADNGTLFLDEIGELPLHLQPKLLRLLQEDEVTPVGGTQAVQVNVRFVAATNRSLAKAVAKGSFRRDLYHRLNIVRIQIPSLRHRREDIELLLDHYLDVFAAEYGQDRREAPADVRRALMEYNWPGNVRELCAWVERLYAADLPPLPPQPDIWDDQYAEGDQAEHANVEAPAEFAMARGPTGPSPPTASIEQNEIQAIHAALAETNHNKSRAADILGIHRSTLLRKMKQYDLA